MEVTQSIHWLNAHPAEAIPLDEVLRTLVERLGESVVVLNGGHDGYTTTYRIGPVAVLENPARPDMGLLVQLSGTACEELGLLGVAELYRDLGLERITMMDWAFDTRDLALLETIESAWRANQVRTRVKVPDRRRLAAKGYQVLPEYEGVRKCSVREEATGRTFYMGSKSSSRWAKAYNRRGFTRLEMRWKGERAAVIGAELLISVLAAPTETSALALGHLRDFVDFIDVRGASNVSRAPLLAWWRDFLQGARKAKLMLAQVTSRSLETVKAWFEKQVAPSFALLVDQFGWQELQRLADLGETRWSRRHLLLRRSKRKAVRTT